MQVPAVLCGMNPAGTGTNGRYIYGESSSLSSYGDVLFTYQQQFTNFSVNASVGASINDYTGNGTGFDSYPGILSVPNVFTMQNCSLNKLIDRLENPYSKPECVLHRSGRLQRSDLCGRDST